MIFNVRRILIVTLIVITPALFLANVWQSYRFNRVEARFRDLQTQHLNILEENKRLIVGIAGLRSPSRIQELAREELDLRPATAEQIERIDPMERGGD